MTKLFISNKSKRICIVEVNKDHTLTLTGKHGKPVKDAGQLIKSVGGIDSFLARCRDYDKTPDEIFEDIDRENYKRNKHNAEVAETRALEAKKQFDALTNKCAGVIEVNAKNLEIVMNYLNTINWGEWNLPTMTIGYKARQYDCDGTIVTTITLNEPYCGKTKFKTISPSGHLDKYLPIKNLTSFEQG